MEPVANPLGGTGSVDRFGSRGCRTRRRGTAADAKPDEQSVLHERRQLRSQCLSSQWQWEASACHTRDKAEVATRRDESRLRLERSANEQIEVSGQFRHETLLRCRRCHPQKVQVGKAGPGGVESRLAGNASAPDEDVGRSVRRHVILRENDSQNPQRRTICEVQSRRHRASSISLQGQYRNGDHVVRRHGPARSCAARVDRQPDAGRDFTSGRLRTT